MSPLEAYLARVTEEGYNVDPYAEILPGPTSVPEHHLVMTRQDARESRLGDYFEIHGRHGLVIVLRGLLNVQLDGCPLHLTCGQGIIYFPFQTHLFASESADALLSITLFSTEDDSEWSCLRRTVFNMPDGWEERQLSLLSHWLSRRAGAAAAVLHEQLLACAAQHRAESPAEPQLFSDLQHLLELPGSYALRVKELAARLNLTPNYLNSAFREAYGIPLGSYLEHRRFGLALSLLANPGIEIKTIAEQTGFLTPSAFCRKIRTWSGLTPSQIREILLSRAPHIRFTPFGQTIHRNV